MALSSGIDVYKRQSLLAAALGERALPDRPATCYSSFREVSDSLPVSYTHLFARAIPLRKPATPIPSGTHIFSKREEISSINDSTGTVSYTHLSFVAAQNT